MTSNDFDAWLDALLDAFPGTQAWLGTIEHPQNTLEVWKKVMSDVDFDDATEVVRLMASGDIDPPAAYDRDRTAGFVRKHAKGLSSARRAESIAEAERRENTRKGRCQPIGPLIKRAMASGAKRRAGEITQEQHDEEMTEIKRVAGSDPNAIEPRYRCALCQDRGTVHVWAPHIVSEAKRTEVPPKRRQLCAVACSCHEGARWNNPPQVGNYKPRSLPSYDESFFCIARPGEHPSKQLVDLMEWVAGSGRHNEFDDWNEGAPFEP